MPNRYKNYDASGVDNQPAYAMHMINEARDVIFSTDTSFHITWWNKAAENFYGYLSAEVKGKLLPDIVKPSLDAGTFKKIDDGIAKHGSWEGQVTHVTRDGSERIIAESIAAIKDAEGIRTGYVFVGRDITAQHQAQQKSHYQSAVLQKITEAVFSTDTFRKIHSWNHGAELMFGFFCDEVTGKTSVDLLKPVSSDNEIEAARETLLKNGHWQGEVVYHHKNGTPVPVEISVSLYKDNDDALHFIYVCRDITDKNMEAIKLLNRTRQLEEANRLIQAMALSVSRDMRRYLHAARHSADKLIKTDGLEANPGVILQITELRHQVDELFKLSDNLISFSDVAYTDIQFTDVNMDALVLKCIDMVLTAKEKMLIRINKSALPVCKGDAAMLEQVWYSLLSASARDACRLAKPSIEIGSRKEGRYLVYYITPYGVLQNETMNNDLKISCSRLSRGNEQKDGERELNFIKRVVLRHGGSIGMDPAFTTNPAFFFTIPGHS